MVAQYVVCTGNSAKERRSDSYTRLSRISCEDTYAERSRSKGQARARRNSCNIQGSNVAFPSFLHFNLSVANETGIEILGFYAISPAELVNSNLPAQYGKRLPAKGPVFRLGRLATALGHQGKGIGEFMLFDAID